MKDIESLYKQFIKGKNCSDIFEHLPILKDIASEVDRITEFGVRGGCSTVSLLMSNPKKMDSFDKNINCPSAQVKRLCMEYALKHNIDFSFHYGDTLDVEIEETDMLFIDTTHTYNHLKAELNRHAEKVSKYIICHDTVLVPDMMKAIDELSKWKIKYHYENLYGLTIIERK